MSHSNNLLSEDKPKNTGSVLGALKKYKDLVIENDSRIIKQKNIYYLIICVKQTPNEKTTTDNAVKQINYCGVDPGIRTFMTSFGSYGCTEYLHNNKLLKLLNSKISKLKESIVF